jgi:hypothetical protein
MIRGRSDAAGTGQCMESSVPQDWCMMGRPGDIDGALSIPPDSLPATPHAQDSHPLERQQVKRLSGYRNKGASGPEIRRFHHKPRRDL